MWNSQLNDKLVSDKRDCNFAALTPPEASKCFEGYVGGGGGAGLGFLKFWEERFYAEHLE